MPPKKGNAPKTVLRGGTAAARPVLLLLAGLPGSGKSTLATELEQQGWVRVSPDDIGIMEECKRLIAQGLKHGRCVVLDRCNANVKERKMFVREAKAVNPSCRIECVCMHTPPEECIRRVKNRPAHPTLDPAEAEKVIAMFGNTFDIPERLQEGPYDALYTVRWVPPPPPADPKGKGKGKAKGAASKAEPASPATPPAAPPAASPASSPEPASTDAENPSEDAPEAKAAPAAPAPKPLLRRLTLHYTGYAQGAQPGVLPDAGDALDHTLAPFGKSKGYDWRAAAAEAEAEWNDDDVEDV